MGYYISVARSFDVPSPGADADEEAWEAHLALEAEHTVYAERLGAITFVGDFVVEVARALGLPWLSRLYPGWCLETSDEWDALDAELVVLEAEWRRRGYHVPGAAGWGRSWEDLEELLGFFRLALQAARSSGRPLCAG